MSKSFNLSNGWAVDDNDNGDEDDKFKDNQEDNHKDNHNNDQKENHKDDNEYNNKGYKKNDCQERKVHKDNNTKVITQI